MEENKTNPWLIVGVAFIIGFCIVGFLAYTYYNNLIIANNNISSLNTQASDMAKQFSQQIQECNNKMQTQADTFNSDMQLKQNELDSCRTELGQFKSSTDYYYSSKMHPNDPTIKKLASDILKEFEESPACFEYGTKDVCNAWNAFGCVSSIQQSYCVKENIAKTQYYNYIAKLDPNRVTGLDDYYIRSIIANYYWVRDNIHYVIGTGGSQTDFETLNIRAGKCDESALLLASLARATGLDARIVLVPKISHAITAVSFDNIGIFNNVVDYNGTKFLLLDTVCSDCGVDSLPDMDNNQEISILTYYSINQ